MLEHQFYIFMANINTLTFEKTDRPSGLLFCVFREPLSCNSINFIVTHYCMSHWQLFIFLLYTAASSCVAQLGMTGSRELQDGRAPAGFNRISNIGPGLVPVDLGQPGSGEVQAMNRSGLAARTESVGVKNDRELRLHPHDRKGD